MFKSIKTRRLIGLLAAYVVALQLGLLPLTVAAGAGFDGSFCAAASSSQSHHSSAHENGCGCAGGCGTQCCYQTFVRPDPVVIVFAERHFKFFESKRLNAIAVRPLYRSPQVARAPPLV